MQRRFVDAKHSVQAVDRGQRDFQAVETSPV
jgi:hypothetical protein